MKQCMLTTVDNPFDPFDQYEAWQAYDATLGHHTPSFLARIAFVSDELSPSDQHQAIESAIDEIIYENINGLYRKLSREIE